MERKTERGLTITLIVLLIIGISIVSICFGMANNKLTEYENVLCWDKPCVMSDSTIVNDAGSFDYEFKEFRNERTTSITFYAHDAALEYLTVDMMRENLEPFVRQAFEVKDFDRKVVYVNMQVMDNAENVLYKTDKGDKPEWY